MKRAAVGITLALVTGLGCAPVQQFFMKEKVITAPPPSATSTDQFVIGHASGQVDVLFVVDNTESGDAAFPAIKTSYTDFLGRFSAAEARMLDYHVQTVTDPLTPLHSWPGDFFSSATSAGIHLTGLFGSANGSVPGILNHQGRGYLTPFASAAAALSTGTAAGIRPSAALFEVHLMGNDVAAVGSGYTQDLDPGTFQQQLTGGGRGFFEAHLMTISRLSDGNFPGCLNFGMATQALSNLHALPWRSQADLDLCDNSWTAFPEKLFARIIAFKKRLVLSQIPQQPTTMLLRSPGNNHLYRYGDDYQLDQQNNEIVFLRDVGLQDGDLLEASYYTTPATQLEPGGQNVPVPVASARPGRG